MERIRFERFLKDRAIYFETLWRDVFDTIYQNNAEPARQLLVRIATHKEISAATISANLPHLLNEQIDILIKSLKEIHLLDGKERLKIKIDSFAEWICLVKS